MSLVLDFDYLLFDSFFLVKDDITTVKHFSPFDIVQSISFSIPQEIYGKGYRETVLKKFGMEEAKAISTPVDPSTKLVKATDEDELFDQEQYQSRSAVGSLMYISVATRPEMTYAVSNVAKFTSNPTKKHWTGVKRIMRYL